MDGQGDALLHAGAIANPRLWRLGMLLDTEAATLSVAATSTVGEEEAICRTIALSRGAAPLAALEDAVYDNPMLLADFDRCTILVRTPRMALMPADIADSSEAIDDAAALLWTDPDFRASLHADGCEAAEAAVMWACDADVDAFLGRTFADARVMHAMSCELRYFAAKAPRSGNAPKLFTVVSPAGVDLFCFDGRRLLGATSYACTDPADMAYYAAATAQVCGVAGPDLQFFIAGSSSVRDAVASTLRRFAPRVMPWILPPALGQGAGAELPFPLLILPLCE